MAVVVAALTIVVGGIVVVGVTVAVTVVVLIVAFSPKTSVVALTELWWPRIAGVH